MKLKPQDIANALKEPFRYIAMNSIGSWITYSKKPILTKSYPYGWDLESNTEIIEGIEIDFCGSWKDSLFEKVNPKKFDRNIKIKPQQLANILSEDFSCMAMQPGGNWRLFSKFPCIFDGLWHEENNGFSATGTEIKNINIDYDGMWERSIFYKQHKKPELGIYNRCEHEWNKCEEEVGWIKIVCSKCGKKDDVKTGKECDHDFVNNIFATGISHCTKCYKKERVKC